MKPLKNDENKPRFDLLPPGPILDAVKVLTFGASKYADYNYLGLEEHRLIASLHRHLNADARGEVVDEETGQSHMAHALTNVLMIMHSREHRAAKTNEPVATPPKVRGVYMHPIDGGWTREVINGEWFEDMVHFETIAADHNRGIWLWCEVSPEELITVNRVAMCVTKGFGLSEIPRGNYKGSFDLAVEALQLRSPWKISKLWLHGFILGSCK